MKKAIVVGGAGFVGSAVVKNLASKKYQVYVVVRPGFFEKNANNIFDNLDVRIIECDLKNIGDLKNILSGVSADIWYQFAWDGLFNEELIDYKKQIMNIKYVMDSIETAARIGCKKFVGSGSISQYELLVCKDKVFKNDKHQVYKTAKMACEYMGKSVASRNNIEFIWPIITNIFGPGENSPRLINTMIRNFLNGKRQSLSEGKQYYDFIYIDDAAEAFAAIGEKGIGGGHYVIGSGKAQPLEKFLRELRDIVSKDAELGFGEMEFNGIYLPKEYYDISELTKDTGFVPKVSFKEAVKRTAEWIKKGD